MTEKQINRCHAIIHSHALAAGAGNAIPVPGLDIAADITALTTMTMALGAVFGQSITADLAKNLVIAQLKKQILKRIAKSAVKLIPVFGWLAGPAMGIAMTEATGWEIANRLARMN
ncbi:MAG: hypothetical protein WCI51_01835 [Lentisphaerota bacterium]